MSCFYISGMFISGVEAVVSKNMAKAFEYSHKACHLGNVYACANLSQMYRKVRVINSIYLYFSVIDSVANIEFQIILQGDGVTKDERKADEYKKMATDMQDQLVKQFNTIRFEEGA